MRIEGVSEVSASQLTGNAFEHHAPARTVTTSRSTRTAANVPSATSDPGVVDVHDSTATTAPRQEVEFKLPRRIVPVGAEQSGIVDRNGDGMISLSDLPFDYFQISRQASRKLITPPATDVPF